MSININPEHKGKLHSALHIAQNKKIPEKALEKKAKAGSALSKEINFARVSRKWHHGGNK